MEIIKDYHKNLDTGGVMADKEKEQNILSGSVSGNVSNFSVNFLGKKFLNNKQEEVTAESSILKSKIIGLYFTSSWCPPCDIFSSELLSLYNEVNLKEKNFEVIQISNERNEIEFREFISKDPWLFVNFEDPFMYSLITEYKINFLPVLIIVNKEKIILSSTGRKDLSQLKSKAFDEWYRLFKEQRERDKELEKLIDN
jgi:nucleoredoxin